jgi:integrase
MTTAPSPRIDAGRVPDTLAELLAWVQGDSGVDGRRRREWGGAIRTVCAVLGQGPQAVPARIPEVDRLLAAVPRAVHGRAGKTLANVRSRLGSAIRACTGIAGTAPRGLPLSPPWRVLRDRLVDPRLRQGLSRLVNAASAAGLDPAQVDDRFVAQMAQALVPVKGEARAEAFRRQAATCWNEAAEHIAGWPAVRLAVPVPAGRTPRLPLEAFPPSFQRDVEHYLAWAAGSGRLARDGSPRSLSAGTLRLRREHLRLAASALARRLGYTRRVINLATLVEPVNFKLVLAEYLDAGGDRGPGIGASGERRPGAFVQGLAVTLFGVARQWVKAPASQLDQLGQLKRRLGGRAAGMAERNRRAIAPFADQRALVGLLALPETLIAPARAEAGTRPLPGRLLRTVQIAVAIQLLLAAPLRLHQLAALRLGDTLHRPAGRAGPLRVAPAGEGAGHEPQRVYPIGAGAREVLDDYLDLWHRDIAPNPQAWLFVRPQGGPLTAAALRDGILRHTRRALGVGLTPGQFRHLAAALVLHERPGDIGLVRDLLGHASVRTTAQLYAGLGTPGAAAVYGALLERARAARKPEIASQAARSSPTSL